MDGEPSPLANLSNASALLGVHLTDINWVGFYLWSERDQELVLGPFQGKPACIRIQPGQGVCGTAWQRRETLVVPDVHQFPGHIACDPASRSEIVVPMMSGSMCVGVLDIDSPLAGRFTEEDARGLEGVVRVLVEGCDFSRLAV
jgi:GAF domain-containing protein